MDTLSRLAETGLNIFALLFSVVLALLVLMLVIFFLIDINQTKDTVRRNFPVFGRFRHFFSHLGEFFRQYFFAMDREEMPFNRAEREWINHVSKKGSETVPFGSTRRLTPGAVIFANGMFPKLHDEFTLHVPKMIGQGAKRPYQPKSYFNISAMSFGALSKPAVQALSYGAAMGECWLNTGEGGVSPYHLEGGCDLVYQLGTAKFGARNPDGSLNADKLRELCEAHPQIKMIELKLSQGAKPGKGGILPAAKVTEEIAKIRHIPVGQDAISPNRHVEAKTPAELLDLIAHIRDISGLPTGIKLVLGKTDNLFLMLEEINRRGIESAPDFITLDSGDGGTGAAPMPLIDNMGRTIRESLPMVVDALQEAGLRERIRVIATGKLITPAEVAWAFCAGADFVSSARGFMFALGCIQAMKCNTNTCPTGVTTHNKRLQRGLDPHNKANRVMNFIKTMRYEVDMIAHSCGVDSPNQLGRDHALIVTMTGKTKPLSTLWPLPSKDKIK
ncbi:MAG TPA: FMN-binding glutamate synthase family protein [Hellea balneolensis]|uniref:FMN-binding glutamate synthase family protein n=1 Tax=Hellea balneolensis TaxID=287478 RepID=A0A7C5QPZ1_9PROT|nr:FMN-binding glutamate synthase family protein [Hellea balneolensis]